MYVNTFEFYKIEKFKKHLDFNLLYNKIKEEIKEDPKTKTSCLDWDNYTWIDKIIEFFSADQRAYLVEVYNIDVDVSFQENVDEVDYVTMEFYSFLEELYNNQKFDLRNE